MNNQLFKIIYEVSPEFREAMFFLSMIGEKHNRTLEEELDLWDANTLPKVTQSSKKERKK